MPVVAVGWRESDVSSGHADGPMLGKKQCSHAYSFTEGSKMEMLVGREGAPGMGPTSGAP